MKKYPIVILHGWNLNRGRFIPLIHEFKRFGFKVFCPDLPGFGKNPLPEKVFNLSDYVDFILLYLKKNKIEKADFIGHSFGGRIAIKLAALHPQKVKTLILTGAPGVVPVPRIKIIFFLILAKIGKIIFSLPGINNYKNSVQKFGYRAAKATDFYNTKENLRETFQSVVKEKLIAYLRVIKSPTLLIWGKNDRIVPVFVAYKMKQLISLCELIIIENTAHSLPFSHPEIFVGKIRKFLKNNGN